MVIRLPYVITGLYTLRRPKVSALTMSSTTEDAEKVRDELQLAIEGQTPEIISTTPGDNSTLKRFVLMSKTYEPIASGSYKCPFAAAERLCRHTKDSVFLVTYLDEHHTDKYGATYVVVKEYRQFRVPVDIVSNTNGRMFRRKTMKKVQLLNGFKCSISFL